MVNVEKVFHACWQPPHVCTKTPKAMLAPAPKSPLCKIPTTVKEQEKPRKPPHEEKRIQGSRFECGIQK